MLIRWQWHDVETDRTMTVDCPAGALLVSMPEPFVIITGQLVNAAKEEVGDRLDLPDPEWMVTALEALTTTLVAQDLEVIVARRGPHAFTVKRQE